MLFMLEDQCKPNFNNERAQLLKLINRDCTLTDEKEDQQELEESQRMLDMENQLRSQFNI
jgi:hypothetical protein